MRGMNLGGDDVDPLLSINAERKAKKAKKEKKEKKDKDKEKKKKQVLVHLHTLITAVPLSVGFPVLGALTNCPCRLRKHMPWRLGLCSPPGIPVVRSRLEHSRAVCLH